jgi:hypothetical protein
MFSKLSGAFSFHLKLICFVVLGQHAIMDRKGHATSDMGLTGRTAAEVLFATRPKQTELDALGRAAGDTLRASLTRGHNFIYARSNG